MWDVNSTITNFSKSGSHSCSLTMWDVNEFKTIEEAMGVEGCSLTMWDVNNTSNKPPVLTPVALFFNYVGCKFFIKSFFSHPCTINIVLNQ